MLVTMPRGTSGREERGVDGTGGETVVTDPRRATAAALARAASARAVVLVEGVSDQVALETLALRRGRDLAADGVVVVPMGGAHGVSRFLGRFGPRGAGITVAGLCDAGEERYVRRGLATAGLGTPRTRADLAGLGFFVCVDDLEDELIRAAGEERVVAVLAAAGDLGSFRTLQGQPAWRSAGFDRQARRFLAAGSRRKLRYARLLVEALPMDGVPPPLLGVLERTG